MAWIEAYKRLREMFAETEPRHHHDIAKRFSIDESEPSEDGPRHSSRTVRLYPSALGTNSADQTPGNRRTFADVACEVYYRPMPRNRTRVIEALGSDYEALRDTLMDTTQWGAESSGIIALSIGAPEVKPATVSYGDGGTLLAFSLALEYEDIQEATP